MASLWKSPNSKYWQAAWRDENGKRRNKSTKLPAKSTTRRQAQRIAEQFEEIALKRKTGKHLREAMAELSREVTGEAMAIATVKDFMDSFLARKQGEVGKASKAFYKTVVRDFTAWLGDRATEDIASVTRADMSRYRNELLVRVSEGTTSNKLKAIRSMFRDALSQGFIHDEPTEGLKFTRKERPGGQKKRPFTLPELQLLCETATGEWRSMILFGLYTGQRMGDIATLRWHSLDLVRGEMRLATRKTGKNITIPLASPLADHLATYPASDDPTAFVHPELGELYETKSAGSLSNQFTAILAECGLRAPLSHAKEKEGRGNHRERNALSFHCLRATAATLLHDAGIPAAVAQEWIGHDSDEVHNVYVKIGRESLRAASKALPDITGKSHRS